MSFIKAKNLSIEIPIYGVKNRSLKTSLVNSLIGGVIRTGQSDCVSVRVLENISFEFCSGDRVGLIGHNGSGKSSLLRAIAGIYSPSSGSLAVEGSINSFLDIFMGMNTEATGFENIKNRCLMMGLGSKKIKSIRDEIAEFSGIGNFLNLPMRTYSSGMAMRLAFSIATSVSADILIMDEWLSVGDADFMKKVDERLSAKVSEADILVLASHDFGLIHRRCNKIVTLEHGKIISIVNNNPA